MSSFFYYLGAGADTVLSVFGIRAPYDQPPYQVVGHIGRKVEIRAYAERTVVETPIRLGNDGEAFGRLFRYITGANRAEKRIAMTVPVQQTPGPVAMTLPADMSGASVMRFFLPSEVVSAGPPVPTDPLVHIARLPPETVAVLRFSGTATGDSRQRHEKSLLESVAGAGDTAAGPVSLLFYDPPFALPFVRRNEVAVALTAPVTR